MSPTPGTNPDFDALFREHAAYVFRCLRKLGVADSEVDDVCQEVFITVQRKLPEFEGRSSLRTWLYGIALRAASDHRRSAYVRRVRPVEDPGELAATTASNSHADAEARQALHTLLDALDEDRRNIVVLYEIEGFTMSEVSEIVGCPLQTAYSRLYSARTLLADAVRAGKAGER